ncbi:MAG: hypothetical protein ACQEWD_04470 [Bacteroidota bacterium]
MYDHYENDFAKFWIDDGILFYVYKPYSIITLDAAKQIVVGRLILQGEQTLPAFCDIRGIKSTEKSAREYLANEGSVLSSAKAFLVEPLYSQMMINFYIKTSKPIIPVKVFTKKKEAIVFLNHYNNKI